MQVFKTSHGRDALGFLAMAVTLLLIHTLVRDHFYRSVLLQAIIFAVAATGMTLLVGFAGQISLGQNAFMAMGTYGFAYQVQKFGLHPLFALGLATLLPTVVAYAIARPILRLSGHYLALATLALGSAGYIFASRWTDVTGGLDPGILDLPKFTLVSAWGGDQFFPLAALCLMLVTGLSLVLVHSAIGRSLHAIHTSELVAACSGIQVERTKAAIFALAAGCAGLSGALYALFMRSFNASSFSIMISIELLMMVIVGSLSTVWGSLIGALLVTLLPHALEHFESAKLFVYGTIMTLVVMFMPNGLASSLYGSLRQLVTAGRKA